jgi:hypothetical protein
MPSSKLEPHVEEIWRAASPSTDMAYLKNHGRNLIKGGIPSTKK